jgi:hypothetical protein
LKAAHLVADDIICTSEFIWQNFVASSFSLNSWTVQILLGNEVWQHFIYVVLKHDERIELINTEPIIEIEGMLHTVS